RLTLVTALLFVVSTGCCRCPLHCCLLRPFQDREERSCGYERQYCRSCPTCPCPTCPCPCSCPCPCTDSCPCGGCPSCGCPSCGCSGGGGFDGGFSGGFEGGSSCNCAMRMGGAEMMASPADMPMEGTMMPSPN